MDDAKRFVRAHKKELMIGAGVATVVFGAFWLLRRRRAGPKAPLEPELLEEIKTPERAEEVKVMLTKAKSDGNVVEQIKCLEMLAIFCGTQQNYEACEQFLQEELQLVEQYHGTRLHAEYNNKIFTLGLVYTHASLLEKAVVCFKESAEIEDKLGVQIHQSWQPLAAAYLELAQFAEAEELFRKCLVECESITPTPYQITAAMEGLAATYLRQSKLLPEAKQLLEKSIEIKKKEKGPESMEVAEALSNMAFYMQSTNDYQQAVVLLQQSTDMLTKLGEDNVLLPTNLNNLAALRLHLGAVDEAIAHLERCKQIFEKQYGPDHPAVQNMAVTIDRISQAI